MKSLFSFSKKPEAHPHFEVNKPGKKYSNPKERKTIYGCKYWVPVIEKMGDPLKETQPELFTVIKKIYSQYDGAFIDVGVNVGQTLVKVHAVDPEISYFGFETNIYACFFVDQFLQMNRAMTNQVIFPVALSNGVNVVKLFRKGLVGAGASIIEKHRDSHSEFKHQKPILTIEGDRVVPQLGINKIALIKIDVEGGELEVLEGFDRTLAEARPFVICESKPIFDCRTNESRENAEFRDERRKKIQLLMSNNGYLIFQISFEGHLVQMDGIDPSEGVTRDYLFVPRERYEARSEFFDEF